VTALTALNELASTIVWLIMSSLFFVFIITAVAPAAAAVACAGVWILDLAVNPRENGGISISQGPHRVLFTADEWRMLSHAVTELLRDPSVPGNVREISDLGDERVARIVGHALPRRAFPRGDGELFSGVASGEGQRDATMSSWETAR
jgi:hypothetical protein